MKTQIDVFTDGYKRNMFQFKEACTFLLLLITNAISLFMLFIVFLRIAYQGQGPEFDLQQKKKKEKKKRVSRKDPCNSGELVRTKANP